MILLQSFAYIFVNWQLTLKLWLTNLLVVVTNILAFRVTMFNRYHVEEYVRFKTTPRQVIDTHCFEFKTAINPRNCTFYENFTFVSYQYFLFPYRLEFSIWQIPTTWLNRLHTRKRSARKGLWPSAWETWLPWITWYMNQRPTTWLLKAIHVCIKTAIELKLTSWLFRFATWSGSDTSNKSNFVCK